ncbi:MAG: hypothetical protein ACKO37_08065, partial [Vampirovibrionales bacterium]
MLFELPPKTNIETKSKHDKSRLFSDLWEMGWRYDGSDTEKTINQSWKPHDSWNVFKTFLLFPEPTTRPPVAPSALSLSQG